MEITDPYDLALRDYHKGHSKESLWLESSIDSEIEEMPVEVFFREEGDLSDLESYALSICRGSVLDVGAGTGVHAEILQRHGHGVVALDSSSACVKICAQRGLSTIKTMFLDYQTDQKFDTIILLMNGIGIAGTLNELPRYIERLLSLLNPNGQLLFDSSDVSYLGIPRREGRFFGEISYRYRYKGIKGEWFSWLYVDQETLKSTLSNMNLNHQVLYEEETGQYLVGLVK